MRDLEIRGAGSLMGEMQHGHMEQVGYDTYCKLWDDVKRKLLDLGFTPRNLKNVEDYINKFIQICGDNAVEKITEIWVRSNGLHDQKKYLMGTIKRIVTEFEK